MHTQKGRTRRAKAKQTIARLYAQERASGTLAHWAIRHARVRLAWEEREWDEFSAPAIGQVRLRVEPDEDCYLDNLFGDTYNPEVNSDIPRSRLERKREAEIERINRDGVWGIIGEYFDGESWVHADSCWGFVGDDWKGSGYDVDIMASTLAEAAKITICSECGRPKKVRKA